MVMQLRAIIKSFSSMLALHLSPVLLGKTMLMMVLEHGHAVLAAAVRITTCLHIRHSTHGTGQRSASFEGAAAWLDLISKKRDKVLFLWADVHKRIQVFFIVY